MINLFAAGDLSTNLVTAADFAEACITAMQRTGFTRNVEIDHVLDGGAYVLAKEDEAWVARAESFSREDTLLELKKRGVYQRNNTLTYSGGKNR